MAELTDHSAAVLACPVSQEGQLLADVTGTEAHTGRSPTGSEWPQRESNSRLRDGTWIPGGRGLCLVGEAGVYRYDFR
jgi:hypothetical protein